MVSGTVYANGITLDNTADISGGTIDLLTGTLSTPTITVNASGGTIGSVLTGTVGLNVTGSGALTLSGNNVFPGGVNLGGTTAGTLNLANNNAIGSGVFWERGEVLQAAAPGIVIPNGFIISNGGLDFSGSNDLTVNGSGTQDSGRSIRNFSASNTLTLGSFDTGGFVLTLEGRSAAGTNGSIAFTAAISGSGSIVNNNPGDNPSLVTTLYGANTYTGSTTITSGTLAVSGGGNLGGGNYAAAISNSGALVFSTSSHQVLSGVLSGIGDLTQAGPGVLVLTASNTYSGQTTVSGGTLALGNGTPGNDGSISGVGGVTDNAALLYNLAGNQAVGYAIGGSGALIKSGTGTLTLTGINTYAGTTTVNGGTLQLAAGGLAPNADEYVGSGGTGSFAQTGGANAINTSSKTLHLGYNGGDLGSYTLGGNGLLKAWDEEVGRLGTGSFTQNGGTNSISGSLILAQAPLPRARTTSTADCSPWPG